ncbi:MAG: aldo/keto reductase [Alphaproteobacteria bacterium]|nr:aldo/keto reductase [Alphaproteobacteria bacterium]
MTVTRRFFCRGTFAAALAAPFGPIPSIAAETAKTGAGLLTRPIPSSGEQMPIVGLGTWITFNVGDDPKLLAECINVVRAFFTGGGRMIDSSPMYGSSQDTIGHALAQLNYPEALFSAEKVWTSGDGAEQIEQSRTEWGVPRFDLMQVHNLVDWKDQLRLLEDMKSEGRLRYIGLTTSHGLRHGQMEQIIKRHPIDFIQITYNVVDRDAEQRLLPLARDRGVAVIVNRPYRQGALIRRFERHPLPDWAATEVAAESWSQFLLKFIISHPDITCAIPATTRVDHVRENLACARQALPDADQRKRMADFVAQL